VDWSLRGLRLENPFADPRWLVVWAQHFARDAGLETAVVRDRGELVGVVPFYQEARGGSTAGGCSAASTVAS
jgi:hypothetical protein